MVRILKSIQLATSVAVTILFWVMYPGVMVVLACFVGLCYMVAAIGAILDNRVSIWLAFVFSALAVVLSTLGVYRFLQNGFDFLTGTWGQHGGFLFYPYLFLIISLGSILVIIMHFVSWRWMIQGKRQYQG